eukprot:XP_001706996.1 Hypothetical protein GL50803_34346 [Giardia lamblia ATCC 50803]
MIKSIVSVFLGRPHVVFELHLSLRGMSTCCCGKTIGDIARRLQQVK